MVSIINPTYLEVFLLSASLLNYFVMFFFFIHFCLFLVVFSTHLWKKLLNKLNIIFRYFFTVVVIIFILYFFKLYLIFKYGAVGVPGYGLNFHHVNFFFFSDTLICLALFITTISWIYLGERYLLNNLFFVMYFLVFIVCTIGMVSTSNILSVILFFELIFLPSLFFVYKFGYSDKVEKTILYLLLWTMTGSLAVLGGTAYLYTITKSLDISFLLKFKYSNDEKTVLFFLFFFGFGIKIPIWPFHYWLTKVHVEAPTGFSIFLSGFLVKTAFFCLTYFYQMFVTPQLKNIALCFIFVGALDASFRMWSVTDIKRLIAFATIQEMNLIFLFFILLGNNNYIILNMFLLVHGILSGFLFFLIDQVQKQFSTRNLTSISGAARLSPMLHNIIWFAILVFRGFPVFIKFYIEYELLNILTINFYFLGCIFFFLVSFFGIIGFARIWFSIIYGQPSIKNSKIIFKKDIMVAIIFIFILTFLQLFIFMF